MAPMVGLSHIAFRQTISSLGGCGLFFSEMLSARRIPDDIKKNSITLKRLSNERPFFYQLLGNDPKEFVTAIRLLENHTDDQGNYPDGIDINLGCSAPFIRRNKMGAGLLADPELIIKILSACRKATPLPLTVKMRMGEKEDFAAVKNICRKLHEAGVDAITFHPRLMKEKFTRLARWKYITELQKNLPLPIIGNGDILTVGDIRKKFEESGCQGIMIGRAAVMKPWIFREFISGKNNGIDKKEVYFLFLENLKKFFNPEEQHRLLKIFTPYYAKNFHFGHNFNTRIINSPDIFKAEEIADNFFNALAHS